MELWSLAARRFAREYLRVAWREVFGGERGAAAMIDKVGVILINCRVVASQ